MKSLVSTIVLVAALALPLVATSDASACGTCQLKPTTVSIANDDQNLSPFFNSALSSELQSAGEETKSGLLTTAVLFGPSQNPSTEFGLQAAPYKRDDTQNNLQIQSHPSEPGHYHDDFGNHIDIFPVTSGLDNRGQAADAQQIEVPAEIFGDALRIDRLGGAGDASVSLAPEPVSIALLGLGLLLAVRTRRA